MANKETILAKDFHFQGRMTFAEDVLINGNFSGQIEGTGTLTIGETGHVEADVVASTIITYGYAKGNIIAEQELEIKSAAKTLGDISTPILSIERGAKFVGYSNQLEKKNS